MRLSVIVPVHNGRAFLPQCLEGLAASTRPADEVIVVNDGSSDGSSSVARMHRAKVIQTTERPRGPAYARNRGSAVAIGEILVFVDADVVLHADTLDRIESKFADQPALQALFGSYDTEPPAPGTTSRFKNLLHHYVHQQSRRDASTFWAGCGAIRRDAFQAVGGFDEAYDKPSIEDVELGLRLRRAGMPIRLCPEIQATHLKHWSLANLLCTDIFARAVPWTLLVLREGRLPDDLNLTWRSRMSAGLTWAVVMLLAGGGVLLLLGQLRCALTAGLGAALLLATSTLLNADLHRFFVRHGGLRFAGGAWLLHHAYLLYSSAVFAALLLAHTLHLTAIERQGRASKGTS